MWKTQLYPNRLTGLTTLMNYEYVRKDPESSLFSGIFGTTPTLQFQKSCGTFGEGSETDYSITSDPFVPFGIYRKDTDPLGVQWWGVCSHIPK